MTNKEAKQEAIKKAYGDLYEPNEHHINEDGLIHYISEPNLVGLKIYGDKFHSTGNGHFVLKELWDIQANNGWTRIEPDGSNLPVFGSYKWITKNGVFYEEGFNPKDPIHVKEFLHGYSHYKPITPELKPIY